MAMIDGGLVTPTSMTYASVVTAFARVSEPEAAEKWLKRMLEACTPSESTAASEVCDAWCDGMRMCMHARVRATVPALITSACTLTPPDCRLQCADPRVLEHLRRRGGATCAYELPQACK